jgi:predicted metal-binding protein
MINPSEFTSAMSVKCPDIKVIQVNTEDFIFEERVKQNCFYCERYGINWKCPPNIPSFCYKTVLSEYEYACFVYKSFAFIKDDYFAVRTESSVYLHKNLLVMERYLFECSAGLVTSFIGGSCKLCKNGCGKERCNNPAQARIPLEATGMNIIKTAMHYGIDISFPVKDYLTRIGLILW